MFHQKIASSLIVLLPAVMLQAQVEPPVRAQATHATAARATENQGVVEGDAILANWLLVGSNNEVALAHLAQEKAFSTEVKRYAKKMVDEHGQFALGLQQYVGSPAKAVRGLGAGGRKSGKDDDDSGDRPQPADAGSATPTAAIGAFDHVALIRDLGAKCLESQTKMLGDKSGSEFDLAFMRMQVAAHTQAVNMSAVFANYASSTLRSTLVEGQKTMQAHLEQAKLLCVQVEKADKAAKIGGGER